MARWRPGIPNNFSPAPACPPRPPPSSARSNDQSTSQGGIIAGLVIGFVASLLLFTVVCSLCKGYRNSRARARAAAAAAARPWPPPEPRARARNDGQQLLRASACGPTACLPAFTYSLSVKHNVTTGSGDEAATCSVCLGVFQLGETVRLLPVCLHLYHVECIDPWLDAHSTCPLCRSDTDPTMDVAGLTPV